MQIEPTVGLNRIVFIHEWVVRLHSGTGLIQLLGTPGFVASSTLFLSHVSKRGRDRDARGLRPCFLLLDRTEPNRLGPPFLSPPGLGGFLCPAPGSRIAVFCSAESDGLPK